MQDDASLVAEQQILILGGSGFIGTRLARLFAERHIPFRIGDLRQSQAFADQWTLCDVRRPETLALAMRGASVIINLAAAHRDDVRPLSLYQETNVDGAANVCMEARNSGIEKIVFTSSVAVYGFHPTPTDEDGPFAPFNEYGKTKLQAEGVYRAWADEDPSRSLVIVRPTAVFGEGNRGNVYNLFSQIAAGRFRMVGNGNNKKSIAYVGNIGQFLFHVLTLGPGTHIFNYVDGPDMDTRALVEFARSSLGLGGPAMRVPKTAAMVCAGILDGIGRVTGRTFPLSAIRVHKFCENTQFLAERVAQSGFVPPFTLREGLDRTIRFEFPSQSAASSAAALAGEA